MGKDYDQLIKYNLWDKDEVKGIKMVTIFYRKTLLLFVIGVESLDISQGHVLMRDSLGSSLFMSPVFLMVSKGTTLPHALKVINQRNQLYLGTEMSRYELSLHPRDKLLQGESTF
ncbi:unnamed protein product [Arabis nemorensis]|uniref:Uncharacterized protein n=1 Tax=Arabis nemorensis TaxID=586526 RepID=A0A565BCZ0_9BRAS|nr:unnamed protein product [Arabis nemorensis]